MIDISKIQNPQAKLLFKLIETKKVLRILIKELRKTNNPILFNPDIIATIKLEELLDSL